MPTLNDYIQDVQTFLRDSSQNMLDPGDIIKSVNRARREVALRTNCLRILPDISAACMTCSVVATGSGYSNTPTITLSAPDFPSGTGPFPGGAQASVAAIVQSGTIASAFVTYGGSGYFQPTASITDASGSGASITVQTAAINTLNANQERYFFSDVDLSNFPGVESIYAVQSVSIIYANYRYSIPIYSFSAYQAKIRNYPLSYTYVPRFGAQFGQGTSGSFFLYPIPSQTYQYELDCYCLPSDLTTNLSVEALPDPWTDAVAYWAAHLSYLQIQNFNAAKFYEDMFERRLQRYSNAARVSRATNPYGRY
jgi:hypothetical protein